MANDCCDVSAKSVLQVFTCTKTNQKFVSRVFEKLLPILFGLGLIGSFFGALAVSIGASSAASNVGIGVLTFLVTFVVALIVFIILTFFNFYLIYVIKTVKDYFKAKNAELYGCCDETKPNEAKKTVKPADGVKAEAVVVRKKPGRKPGSKVAKKPAAKAAAK